LINRHRSGADPRNKCRRHGEGDRIEHERDACSHCEQQSADRRSAELIADRVGGIQPGIGLAQVFLGHGCREQCARRVVSKRFGGAEQEQRQINSPQWRAVE
jgi:hypothetical protein